MGFLDVIDERDEVIGKASKQDIYKRLLSHRIVHIFIFNDKEEMALQLRSNNVPFCPLHWCTAAAGHVQSGESYEQAAMREMKEEIGTTTKIEFLHKDIYVYGNQYDNDNENNKIGLRNGLKKMIATFRCEYNGPFNIDPDEVYQVEFFTMGKIQEMINKGENIHPETLFLLRKHFGIQ